MLNKEDLRFEKDRPENKCWKQLYY